MNGPAARFRIGELARRTRVSPELLRAWESRYGLLRPERTAGGFRLYSVTDEWRVRRMRALVRSGLSANEAAGAVVREDSSTGHGTTVSPALLEELDAALMAFDESGAHNALDRLFSTVALDRALGQAILPELRSVGDRWAAGTVSVAQEHFAATLVRGRLLGLARGWDEGRGPRALLACLPDELHDIGLIAFGLLLHAEGWRILYLGQDAPLDAVVTALKRCRANALVLASVERHRFDSAAHELGPVGRGTTTAIGGAGATESVARRLRAILLSADPASAAAQLSVGAARSSARDGRVNGPGRMAIRPPQRRPSGATSRRPSPRRAP